MDFGFWGLWLVEIFCLWFLPLVVVIIASEGVKNRGAWIAVAFFMGLVGAIIYFAVSPAKGKDLTAQAEIPSRLVSDQQLSNASEGEKKLQDIRNVLGEDEKPDFTVYAENLFSQGSVKGSVSGIACLGTKALAFASRSVLERNWKAEYKDIQNIEATQEDEKPLMVVTAPSLKETLILHQQDFDKFVQELRSRVSYASTPLGYPVTILKVRFAKGEIT